MDILRYVLMPFIFGSCSIVGIDCSGEWIIATNGAAYHQNWLIGDKVQKCTPALNGFLHQRHDGGIFYSDLRIPNGVGIGNAYMRYWMIHNSNEILTIGSDNQFSIYSVIAAAMTVSCHISRSVPIQPHWEFNPDTDVPFGIRNGNLLVYRGREVRILGDGPVRTVPILQPHIVVLLNGHNRMLVITPWGEEAWYATP